MPENQIGVRCREHRRRMKNLSALFGLALLATALKEPLFADSFQLVSALDPAQAPAVGGSGDSSCPVLSPDGRFVLFASAANNLVRTTNNTAIPLRLPAALNVYLRDRTNRTTALVSVNLSGVAGGNADSLPIDLSSDGRFVLFESNASDLTPNDTNTTTDVFVRDVLNGATTLVSVSTNGVPGNGASRSSVMTPNGRYVAFVSAANNLVPGDKNRIPDVFVRDLQTGTTALVSVGAVSTNSTIPVGGSDGPEITPDGRYVAFMSTATNLVTGVPAGGDVYVRDLVSNTTTWASAGARAAVLAALKFSTAASFNQAISADGQYVSYVAGQNPSTYGVILRYNMLSGVTDLIHTNAAVIAGNPDMTPDGRFIAFVANTNGNSGANTCICIWDAQSTTITVASADLNGKVSSSALCDWPSITPDGHSVVFLSSATNLTSAPFTGNFHLYVRDLQAGTTALLDGDTNGLGSAIGPATVPRLSADSRFAAFECSDGNLVPNDRNRSSDIFVRDLAAGSTELISAHDLSLASASPNGPSTVSPEAMSGDGRFVTFASEADNLFPGDTNGCRDVFLRDFASPGPILVSVNTNGLSGHGPSTEPSLSGDGRFVAFTSAADDLVGGDTNHAQDVFIRDLQTGVTSLVSVNTNGSGPGNKSSYSPMLSADGRYVLFRSLASNLAPGTFSGENLFLRDLNSGTTRALTTGGVVLSAMLSDASVLAFIGRAAGSTATNFYVWTLQSLASIYTNSLDPLSAYRSLVASRDGTRFAYSSMAPGALGGRLSLVDLLAGTNTLLDAATAAFYPGIRFSRDGLLLAYSRNVMTTNQLCLYDLQAGTTSVLNESYSPPAMPLGNANALDISPDARFIVYRSPGTNSLSTPNGNIAQIFLYDRQTRTNTLLTSSRWTGAASDNLAATPLFSENGQTLLFQSWASDLVSQDFNHGSDLFAFTFFSLAISTPPGGPPRLSWPAVPGNNYRVQFTDKLPDGAWQDLSSTITNFANKAWLVDPRPAPGQRFYRVYSF